YDADERFVGSLPPDLAEAVAAGLAAQTIPLPDHLAIFTTLWERYGRNQGARVRVQLAPGNLHWCSDAALDAVRDAALRYGAGRPPYARGGGGTAPPWRPPIRGSTPPAGPGRRRSTISIAGGCSGLA